MEVTLSKFIFFIISIPATLTEFVEENNKVCQTEGKCKCPLDGLAYRQLGQKCLVYIEVAKSWSEARTFCKAKGGDLVKITSSAQNDFVGSLMVKSAWIGLGDRQVEGDFRWTDGSKARYTSWGPGQPDDAGAIGKLFSEEDCVELTLPSHRWNDNKCDVSLPFVCEMEAVPDCGTPQNGSGTGHVHWTGTSPGSVVYYSCLNGYWAVGGDRNRTCLPNATWSGKPLECKDVRCPVPTTRLSNWTGTRPGDVLTHRCAPDQVAVAGYSNRTCLTTGSWSGTPLVCLYPDTQTTRTETDRGNVSHSFPRTQFNTGYTSSVNNTAPFNYTVAAGNEPGESRQQTRQQEVNVTSLVAGCSTIAVIMAALLTLFCLYSRYKKSDSQVKEPPAYWEYNSAAQQHIYEAIDCVATDYQEIDEKQIGTGPPGVRPMVIIVDNDLYSQQRPLSVRSDLYSQERPLNVDDNVYFQQQPPNNKLYSQQRRSSVENDMHSHQRLSDIEDQYAKQDVSNISTTPDGVEVSQTNATDMNLTSMRDSQSENIYSTQEIPKEAAMEANDNKLTKNDLHVPEHKEKDVESVDSHELNYVSVRGAKIGLNNKRTTSCYGDACSPRILVENLGNQRALSAENVVKSSV